MKKYSKMMLAIFAGAITIASCSSNDDYTVDNLGSRSTLLGSESGEVASINTINGHEYVDLGLSVNWATMNVGATEIAGKKINPHTKVLDCYGEYYAWGETAPKDDYTWSTLKYCSGSSYRGPFTKYISSKASDATDNKTILEMTDDAAHINWGGMWHMPTYAEQTELQSNCYWEWTTSYNNTGVKGYIVYKVKDDADKGVIKYNGSTTTPTGSYSLSDNHIFLPATGCHGGTDVGHSGFIALYLSSSLYEGYSEDVWGLYFASDLVINGWPSKNEVSRGGYLRCSGYSVRPVCPKIKKDIHNERSIIPHLHPNTLTL